MLQANCSVRFQQKTKTHDFTGLFLFYNNYGFIPVLLKSVGCFSGLNG